jgi:23S rRNA maturation-related 3'-5' exoribonuclease YhaM
MKLKYERELALIQDPQIRKLTGLCIDNFPEKFWLLGASSTNRYHPKSSSGMGGLVRHTREVFWIANTIIESRMWPNVNNDVVLAACLLHDGWKYGSLSNYTIKNHATIAAESIADIAAISGIFEAKIPDWYFLLLSCVQSHNGRFTKEWEGRAYTDEQKLVHVADYIASRKFLELVEEECLPR